MTAAYTCKTRDNRWKNGASAEPDWFALLGRRLRLRCCLASLMRKPMPIADSRWPCN